MSYKYEKDECIGIENLPPDEKDDQGKEQEEYQKKAKEFQFSEIKVNRNLPVGKPLIIKDVVSFIQDFVKPIEFPAKDSEERTVFRGMSSLKYEMEPSIFREEFAQHEAYIYRELERHIPEELNGLTDLFDKLCKMQHYSLPTRLLDLTTNPLVALYFACHCENPKEKKTTGKVVAIQGRFYYANEPVIQRISALANFHTSDPTKKYTLKEFINYLNMSEIYYTNKEEIIEALGLRWVGVIPNSSNARIKAQQGLFLLFGLGRQISDDIDEFPKQGENYAKINLGENEKFECRIPPSSKESILEDLEKLGIHKATLMPDLESISRYIKSKYVTNIKINGKN